MEPIIVTCCCHNSCCLPYIRSMASSSSFSARARETINLLERETPASISTDLWSPNSPDLNPVDYKVGIMQQRVYQTKMQDVDNLKQCLIDGWDGMKQSDIYVATDQWCRSLHTCMRARGGHFEYSL